jgi:transcription elongation factor GreA
MNQDYHNYITQYTLDALTEKLLQLEKIELPEVIKEKARAYEEGGPHENAGWESALHRAGLITGQIEDIQKRIKDPVIIDNLEIDTSRVGIGTIVEIIDCDIEEKFKCVIVGFNEMIQNQENLEFISFMSPLGKSLLNNKKDEIIDLNLPDGSKTTYKILSIERYFK